MIWEIPLAIPTHVRSMSYMRKNNREIPSISDAEWVVMRVIWDRGRVTANEMVEALEGQQDWKPKTVHTLLRRLADKGVLQFEKSGREYVFSPLIEREEAEEVQSHLFIERIFAGKPIPFLARFMETTDLSESDIAELRKVLKKKAK